MRGSRARPTPLIRLRINQVEPLAGAAESEDGVEVAFDGWMELIGAIAELLTEAKERSDHDRRV